MAETKVETSYEYQVVEADREQVKALFEKMSDLFSSDNGKGRRWTHEVIVSACAAAIGVAAGMGDFDIEPVIENVAANIRLTAKDVSQRHKAEIDAATDKVAAKAKAYVEECEKAGKEPDPKEIEALITADLPSGMSIRATTVQPKSKPAFMVGGQVGHA